jgi:hypothetical protein
MLKNPPPPSPKKKKKSRKKIADEKKNLINKLQNHVTLNPQKLRSRCRNEVMIILEVIIATI